MLNPLNNATVFLISTLFDLYIFVWLIRLVLIALRVNYFNPVSQIVIKLTQPIAVPLRRILPNFNKIEFASVLTIFVLEILKFLLLCLLVTGIPNPAGLLVLASADFLKSLVNLFFYAILLQVIMSWTQTGHSPLGQVIDTLTTPIMRPIQRLIPPLGGIDISPIFAMLLLQLTKIIIVEPLFVLGSGLTFGA